MHLHMVITTRKRPQQVVYELLGYDLMLFSPVYISCQTQSSFQVRSGFSG